MLYMHFPMEVASLILINFLLNRDIIHIQVIKVLKLYFNKKKIIFLRKIKFKKKLQTNIGDSNKFISLYIWISIFSSISISELK